MSSTPGALVLNGMTTTADTRDSRELPNVLPLRSTGNRRGGTADLSGSLRAERVRLRPSTARFRARPQTSNTRLPVLETFGNRSWLSTLVGSGPCVDSVPCG